MNIDKKILSDITVYAKYARYIPEEKRRETWDEIVDRNMNMHVAKFPFLKDEIEAVYNDFVRTKKFVPSARTLQFAGRAIDVNNTRVYNCFAGETEVETLEYGLVPFTDIKGETVHVINKEGKWVEGTCSAFGEQVVHPLTLSIGKHQTVINTTLDHRWFLSDGSRVHTHELKTAEASAKGTRWRSSKIPYITSEILDYSNDGFIHGFIYGDGTKNKSGNNTYYQIRLCGKKKQYLPKFAGYKFSYPPSCNGDPYVYLGNVNNYSEDLKSLPKSTDPFYIAGFLHGLLSSDGSKDGKQVCGTEEMLQYVRKYGHLIGKHLMSYREYTGASNFNRKTRVYTGTFRSCDTPYSVSSLGSVGINAPVFCMTVPEGESFTLAEGVVTSNCSYAPVDHPDVFAEFAFLLLGGTGVGFSVQKHHIEKLPTIMGVEHPTGKQSKRRYLVADSIEGWADAFKVLIESYFYNKREIDFDFRSVRNKGTRLVTAGGKAPGPEPLRKALVQLIAVFETAIQERGVGTKLKSLEVHDIICSIADAVRSGGIRRSALISVFDRDDNDMLTCKQGEWWVHHPQRALANNSAVLPYADVDEKEFFRIWKAVEVSGCGEPGIIWTNDKDWSFNPCGEASLRPYTFCNLVEINGAIINSQEEFNAVAKAAMFVNTLQASYTNFHYLRSVWRENTEEDALVGVGITGIASKALLACDEHEAALVALAENERVAELIGINKAKRNLVIKPAGTTSLLCGSSSGIHAWHNDFYIRRMTLGKDEALAKFLMMIHPEIVEQSEYDVKEIKVSVPQKAPEGAILRTENVLDTLERVKRFNLNWCRVGHREGANSHNVSTTISVKDDEWEKVGNWMWENRNSYHGIAVLPYNGGTYRQAPFEDITKERYEELLKHLTDIDLRGIIEEDDETDMVGEVACGGGGCTIT